MIYKAKTRQQIAAEYGICSKTFKKWLDREGLKLKEGILSPTEQNKIYLKFGFPEDSELFPNVPIYSD